MTGDSAPGEVTGEVSGEVSGESPEGVKMSTKGFSILRDPQVSVVAWNQSSKTKDSGCSSREDHPFLGMNIGFSYAFHKYIEFCTCTP